MDSNSEAIIRKYDFQHGTNDTEREITDELDTLLGLQDYRKDVDLAKFKNIVQAFTEKVCMKGFAKGSSPGYYMAKNTLEHIKKLKKKCCNNYTMTHEEGRDVLFQLYVDMMKAGPGTTHCELLSILAADKDLKEYIPNVTGNDLLKVVAPLKEISYTPEPKVDDDDDETEEEAKKRYLSKQSNKIPRELERILGDDNKEEKAKKPENWDVFIDLYLSLLVQITKKPQDFESCLSSCQTRIEGCYPNKNPYREYKNPNVVRSHLKTLVTLVQDPSFPQHEKAMENTVRYFKKLKEIVKDEFAAEMFEDLILFMKAVVLSPAAQKLENDIGMFGGIVTGVDNALLEANPKFFTTWAPVMAEILESARPNENMSKMIEPQVWEMYRRVKPAKDYDKYWIPVLKGLVLWPYKHTFEVAVRVLQENKWKRTWNWKKNLPVVKEIIIRAGKADLPTVDDGWPPRDTVGAGGDLIEELLDQLEIVKLNLDVQTEVGFLAINLMERKNELINKMTKEFVYKINLKKCKEIIPQLLARFEVLIRDDDCPWLEYNTSSTGQAFMERILESYSNSKEIPDEVNERFISIFQYVSDDDKEMVDLTNGNISFYGNVLARVMYKFISMHQESDTQDKIEELIPIVFKWQEKDEHDQLTQMMDYCFQLFTDKGGKIIALYMDQLMDVYIESQSLNVMQCITNAYEYNPDPVAEKFEEMVDVLIQDTQGYMLHGMLLKKVAEIQPELFTESVVEKLMEHHFVTQHVNSQILMVFDVLAETNALIFAPYLESKFYNNPMIIPAMGLYTANVVYKVAIAAPKCKESAFNYFLNTLKKSSDPSQMNAMLNGLRELAFEFGPAMFEPHKKYIEGLKTSGSATYVKDSATHLIDVLEGRSLKKVSDDVEETKKDVGKLNISVAGTKVVLKRVARTVRKHEGDIKEVKAGLVNVNERVDDVEQDLEDTKGKVEEIDKKTMSNAPVWSRDLTKLMNPKAKADWRLFATRLGYGRDDIKAWATQADPCMALLSEWYATHTTKNATHAVLQILQEINRLDAAAIVENAMKAVENVVPDEPVEYAEPPQIFLSYQWGHQNEVKLIKKHLEMAGYTCWMDIGQMGGGDKLFEKIDSGIRGAKVIVCCVTGKYAKSPNCIREVNLSVTLGKPIIPLLIEKMSWPPPGSMGPIFSEYIFIRFFQRPGEETKDDRIWPVAKFVELLMQFSYLNILPNKGKIAKDYKEWWKPVEEAIVIPKKKDNSGGSTAANKPSVPTEEKAAGGSPEVFISYQWGKQTEISALYQRLTSLGLHCWMDIHQMGGGDSLYDKIDSGIRGSKVVISSVTPKYAKSMNCRREVSLADALQKPIIPMLMEKMVWPPDGPMSMALTQLIYINFTKDDIIQKTWKGQQFDELMAKIRTYVPDPNAKPPEKPEEKPKPEPTPPIQEQKQEQPKPVQQQQQEQPKPIPQVQEEPKPVQQQQEQQQPAQPVQEQQPVPPVQQQPVEPAQEQQHQPAPPVQQQTSQPAQEQQQPAQPVQEQPAQPVQQQPVQQQPAQPVQQQPTQPPQHQPAHQNHERQPKPISPAHANQQRNPQPVQPVNRANQNRQANNVRPAKEKKSSLCTLL